MKDVQVNDLDKRIINALKKSGQMLLEQKRKNKQKMAILENGKIKIIDFSKQSNNFKAKQ